MGHLLSDRDMYKLLNKDPMMELKDELHTIVEDGKGRGVLSKKEAAYLDPLFCRTPIVNGIESISAILGQ